MVKGKVSQNSLQIVMLIFVVVVLVVYLSVRCFLAMAESPLDVILDCPRDKLESSD